MLDMNSGVIDLCLSTLESVLPLDRFISAEEYLTAIAMREIPVTAHDSTMWLTLAEQVLVCSDRKLRFIFIDGNETVIDIPERIRPNR